jgi:2'-5' RNA ligase
MRVFIAIDIDDKIRKAIADVQRQLDTKVDIRQGDVKWVEPENIHLTLKFLGEIEDEQAPEVCDIVKQVAASYKNFVLDIESVGSFPQLGSLRGGGRSAKVVWVGVTKGAGELLTLQKDLESRLAQAGYPPEEREFSAHLTVCRVKNLKAGFKLAEAVGQFAKLKLGSVAADAIHVYQSQLTPAGPVYTLLGSFKLVQN